MRRTRGKNRPVAEINVVPYIDVMMVLLVIFIATAPVVMQGVKVDLPQAQSQAMSEDSIIPLICTVDAKGQYYVEIDGNEMRVGSLQALTSHVKKHLEYKPNVPVVVQGDAKASYDSVIQLMNALKMAGVESVGLVTDPIDTK